MTYRVLCFAGMVTGIVLGSALAGGGNASTAGKLVEAVLAYGLALFAAYMDKQEAQGAHGDRRSGGGVERVRGEGV
ncbi:MAG: hypothetical protein L0Z53_06590 [Acidobacteriales bacterium]|nr:hypothetical protein [Terriglobales bacterium]